MKSIEEADYIVQRGQVYRVAQDDHGMDPYLVAVENIPAEYWEQWDDE